MINYVILYGKHSMNSLYNAVDPDFYFDIYDIVYTQTANNIHKECSRICYRQTEEISEMLWDDMNEKLG